MTTQQRIIEAGLDLWRKGSEADVTARAVGAAVGISHPGVLHHTGTAAKLRNAVAMAAVAAGDPVVIPKLIVAGHSAVAGLSAVERQRWLAGCSG